MTNLIAFIIRTIIMNPTVILGVVFAAYYKFSYPPHIVRLIFTSAWVPYAVLGGLALLYTILFKHVYYPNTKRVNWFATLKSSVGHLFVMAVSAACAFAIFYAWDYAFARELDDYLRYKKR